MKNLLCILSYIQLVSIPIFCSDETINRYFIFLNQHPMLIESKGDSSLGEIEIILDREKMEEIEKKTGRDVGIVYQDLYWVWINDACKFPSGAEGVYGRIVWMKSLTGPLGVVVIPLLTDGRIALNCNYRHATRSWEVELPRGAIEPGEDVFAAAKREVIEETGLVLDKLTLLGEMTPDTGLTSTIAPVFSGIVEGKHKAKQEDSEAIEEILFLTLDEIKSAFKVGYYDAQIKNKIVRIPFRDPFLSYAILMLELKGLSS